VSGRGLDKKSRRPWSAADDAQLVALVGQGLSRRDVAALAGRSQGAVRIRAKKLNVQFCPERAKQRAREAMAAIRQSPEYRAKLSAGVKAAMTDERRAYHSERCTKLRLWERGQAVLATDAEAAKRRAEKASVNLRKHRLDAMAWCPPAYRDEYHVLASKLRGRGGAEQARRMIEDTIARDKRRAAADARKRMLQGTGRPMPTPLRV
jgi:hypothetical protein